MLSSIKWILKSSSVAYIIYNRVLSIVLTMYGLFCKIDDTLILINSFGGTRYDDSPRAIYEYMRTNPKYRDYKIIWVFDKLPKNTPKDLEWVKNNSVKFFKTALKAKYWITNSSMERGLKFKKANTVEINTWHGSALKKMGCDTGKSTKKLRVSKPNIFYCQSEYDKETFVRAFNYPESCMRIVGLPRNDELAHIANKQIFEIRQKLNIPKNKKVILYAPTFRDYATDTKGNYLAPPFDIEKWRNALSKDYIILFRAHYAVSKVANIKYDNFIRDATTYENLNELMIASDILVSDYSSIMIDYSILERPIFAYGYDLEEYEEKRGLYFDLDKTLPNGIQKAEDEIIHKIQTINFADQKKRTIKFKSKFVEKCGHATEYIDEIIKG